MPQVLEDITVLDFSSGWAGSVATMILADFGAEVIKVEPPEGDPYREWPQSKLWNRGKKSLSVDLKNATSHEKVKDLVSKADIIVESFLPGDAEELGIGYESISKNRPDIIYCSITAFGPTGPYARYKPYEGLVAAKAGRYGAFVRQTKRDGPHYGAVQVGSHGATMAAVRGILAALIVREKTGQGQKVETSLLQGLTPFDVSNWITWQMMVKYPDKYPVDPQSDPDRMPGIGYTPIRTKDGRWIQVANLIVRLFHAELEAMGLKHTLDEERFSNAPTLLPEDREDLRKLILEKGLEKTLDEWMDIFANQTSNVAAEPFMTTQEGMTHPQIVHNEHVVSVNDPEVGEMKQIGVLVRMNDTPGSVKGPAPHLGANNDEVFALTPDKTLNKSQDSSAELPENPLQGITVLDLSTVIAGPLSTSLVHELGARVIRIETMEGDTMRRNWEGLSANRVQAGAENISINLREPEGLQIFNKLAQKVDVLVHNMRPGAPERLGIGYEQVKTLNPNIVYVYAGGYGDSGPSSHRPAMHPIGGAVTGGAIAQIGKNAIPSTEEMMPIKELQEAVRKLGRANEVNPDPNSAMVISTGTMLGLYARAKHGIPQYILSTMIGANGYANVDDFFSYENKPDRMIPDANGYGIHALYRLYKTKVGWVFLACPFENEWVDLCNALGKQDLLNDSRFKTSERRMKNDSELATILQEVFSSATATEWESMLTTVNVGCVEVEESGMYNFYGQDSHVAENGFVRTVSTDRLGEFWRYGPMVNLSRTPARVGVGPIRGQHTRSILSEIGYSDSDIDNLYTKKVVGTETFDN
ncbi:CoA transferase [Dehalococcoidia bacterium]|nr:CoA transferase [Dehalococcoidia bacterium]